MGKVDELIDRLRVRVKEYFSKDASGHNIDHLERTLKYALYLQSKEGGDVVVIAISAFIHDIHRILCAEKNMYVHPKESLDVAFQFINDLEIDEEQKIHILHAIEHHEEYAFGEEGINVDDIESKIVQDADNLEAIGAVGLVRLINYGIANNIVVYDPSVPLYQDEYNDKNVFESLIHHIYNKLLRLGDNMHTNTAKLLAKRKTKFLRDFMDMYIEEVMGNYNA